MLRERIAASQVDFIYSFLLHLLEIETEAYQRETATGESE